MAATSSLGTASTAQAASSSARRSLPGPLAEVIDAWAKAPAAHPVLGDWRMAGRLRGGKDRAGRRRVVSARRLGIKPGTERDVSGDLQRALDTLGAEGGGVLELDRGRYVLDNPLFVHDSHVVLRGQGPDATTLYFSRPLEESIASVHDANGQSFWSWTGGQVFFIARERLAASQAGGWDSVTTAEGWLAGDTLAHVAPADRGADVLLVDDTSGLTAGAMVILEVDNTDNHRLLKEAAGNVAGADTYDWTNQAALISTPSPLADFDTWRWPVVVEEILTSRTVRIEQPLRLALHRSAPARLRALGPTLHDSGVEGLTVENKLLTQTKHNRNPGSNGVCFQAVHDCWADNIRVVNADAAFTLTSAKSCTLSRISNRGRALHHFAVCRVQSHDNLVEDFRIEDFTVPPVEGAYFHGLNVEGLSSGNVYRRGTMETGTFDSHRQMPFENLRTDITLTNSFGTPGGAINAGPRYGARSVHWGIKVTGPRDVCIEITDAAPRSLTAGIVGTAKPGSSLGNELGGDLESERLAFGTDLGRGSDLLELQRAARPLG